MSRARYARVAPVVMIGLAIIAGPLLPGCGGEEAPDPTLIENSPAVKAKESMDYYRNNMMKKKKATIR